MPKNIRSKRREVMQKNTRSYNDEIIRRHHPSIY
ncbi:MAG TPA: hypothetical protein DIT99_01700 [Candidatus Latescibacteria bacterium]|nr:hypothetical protein [Candidatus Latescibacterota bacterium]